MDTEKQFKIRDLRRKEKFFIDDLYLNGYAQKCGVYATSVYLSLCRHSNKEQKSWPSIRKLMEELSISSAMVQRGIKILEGFNIIKRERIGKGANNRYYLIDKSNWTGVSQYDTRGVSPQINQCITTDQSVYHHRLLHSKDTHSKDTHSKERENKFSPPSLDEVKNYCNKRNNNINPSSFIDFYESKGWMVGKNKMKDWRAAVRTWENRQQPNQEEELKIPSYAKHKFS